MEYAAGTLKLPSAAIGESRLTDWALFDGPPDLAGHADQYLAEGFGR